ncbi:hypothetical protein FKM82_028807 [Ascaphus truei]
MTLAQPEKVPFMTTLCCLSFNQFSIQVHIFLLSPICFILYTNLLCETVSKAFANSKSTTSTALPWSKFLLTSSKKQIKLVWHES